jgi:hypothetical protein
MIEVNGGPAQLAGDDVAAAAAVARQDAAMRHTASYQCTECDAVAAVDRGTWVRVVHGERCSRRRRHSVAVTARRRRLAACASAKPRPPQPSPAAGDVPPAETKAAEPQPEPAAERAARDGAMRHANRRQQRHRRVRWSRAFSDRVPTGVRAGVVARWFVSGARVVVQGWSATCRRIVREAGRLWVWVDFDDGWVVDEPFDIFELAAAWAGDA